MSAYKVADAKNLIKLDAMENPYLWPEDMQQQWLQVLKNCHINRYPDSEAKALSAVLRQNNNLPEQSSILLGNGSDEIIQILLMALSPGACVLAPEPGFVMYKQIARSLGLQYYGIPLLADSFDLDMPAMLTAIQNLQPALIFLAYPNNPTGNLFDAQAIKQILTLSNGLVVIDEAYAPFANASFISELENYHNLLVMRTVSKLGLAGLRLGYLLGRQDILAELNKIRLPYNINSLTQVSTEFALKNTGFLLEQTASICEQRSLLYKTLQGYDHIRVYPSAANFIMFRVLGMSADQVFESVKQQGVLIKNLSPQGGLLENCLRVTIGTREENTAFLKALQTAISV
jgi:histidinol-phosphate aminotransferase